MNIFLTGDKNIGKTTIIKKVLAATNFKVGGFFTFFAEDKPHSNLYMCEAGKAPVLEKNNIVAVRNAGACTPYSEKFDNLGCLYIRKALLRNLDILIADECGFLEENSLLFQEELLNALSSDVPILGAVKKNSCGWLSKIVNHPKVQVIEITVKNRDLLVPKIIKHYEKLVHSKKDTKYDMLF